MTQVDVGSSPAPEQVCYERVACDICGASESTLRFPDTRGSHRGLRSSWAAICCTSADYGIHPPIVECTSCGLVYANPQPVAGDLQAQYEAVEDPLYVEERLGRELTFSRHLSALEKHTGLGAGRRLLDVGAYIGIFIETAEKAGWKAWGLEPSHWAADYGQTRGLQIVRGSLEDKPFEPSSFDAVTLWDVIEHLKHPSQTVRDAYELLEPGGWIAVHTMDLDSLMAKLMGKRWPWLMEMHLFYFSRRTLAAVLANAGFEQVTVRAQGRYLRLSYLITRLRRWSPALARVVDICARVTGLHKLVIPINFGDLVTAYAQKPKLPFAESPS